MSWETTYTLWNDFENLEDEMRENLDSLEGNTAELEEAFYTNLEFGTAGMRGVIGAGTNRMNVYTVRQATEGLARFIEEQGEEAKKRGVVIAYDSRHKSPEFSLEAAKTLGKHGIKTYLFESLRTTPELSFAVRHLNTFSGIMMTASHNPPEYNGYKVYGEDGGQFPPAEANKLTEYVRQVENILEIDVLEKEELLEQNLLEIIGEAVDEAYLEKLDTVNIDHELIKRNKDLNIVFSPLHGTATMIGSRALENAGFENVTLEPKQAQPDPDFTTVKLPNPEDPAAFELSIELGKEIGAEILIATDPDADRLGMAALLENGEYEVLTGNQIAALIVDYLLKAYEKQGTLPENGAILKSIVSSEMPAVIAEKSGVETVNVLTGFKFIAQKIKEYEATGEKEFLFGFEESYGYLLESFVRDKDAIQTLIFLAEIAAYYKEQGMTCYDGLQNLFEEYGYFKEKTISITMSGITGAEKIKQLMTSLRQEAPTSFGGVQVEAVEDYQASTKTRNDGQVETIDFDQADVLKYYLADGSWIAARPSGTEPKIKFYIGAVASTNEEADQKVARFEDSINEYIKE
ncbi:phosphoglucomutase [Atopostipes suicloacalis DSM 15692]|uniref:Phosphoglucomutase n=1 Tax=Atopostipes suicloacalis DSM 15692 TaxID=1121025 RepID=A0A1M4S690_9LACT|nr:phospho-sugar mutase [Atopostipes suicloacalis]SHE27729.1 phosphoglucomutase [Atopostipes suicloacalis DSM 15692]